MIIKFMVSTVFLLLLFETAGVLIKSIKRELEKNLELGSRVDGLKVTGLCLLILAGLYVDFFLIWLIWIPEFQPHLYAKAATFFLAVSYIIGVMGMRFSMKKASEFGGLASRMPSRTSSRMEEA